MKKIIVTFRDESKEEFIHKGRPGGSYTIHAKFEGGFVTIEDEWGTKKSFPESNVKSVEQIVDRYY